MRIPLSRILELGVSKSSGEVSSRHHDPRRTSFGRELEHALRQPVISDRDSSQAAPRPELFLPAVTVPLPKVEELLPRGMHDLSAPQRLERDPFVRVVTKQLSVRAAGPRIEPSACRVPLVEPAQDSPEARGTAPRVDAQTATPSADVHTSAPREGVPNSAPQVEVAVAASRVGAHTVVRHEDMHISSPREDVQLSVPRVEVRTAVSREGVLTPASPAQADASAPRTITHQAPPQEGGLETPHDTERGFAEARSVPLETPSSTAPAKGLSTARIIVPGASLPAHTGIAQTPEHTMQPSIVTSHSPPHHIARQESSYQPGAPVRPDLTRPDLTRPELARPELARPEPSRELANTAPPARVGSLTAANTTSDTIINKAFDAVRHVVTEGVAQSKSIDPLRGSELPEAAPPMPATVRSLAPAPTPGDKHQHDSMTQQRSTHENANTRALHPSLPAARSTYVDAAPSTARETIGSSGENSATTRSASTATPTTSPVMANPAASPTVSAAATSATLPVIASRPEANLSNSEALIAQVVQRLAGAPTNGTVTLRLDPPELGTLIVRFERRGGQLNVTMSAERDDVARLLKQDLGQLQSSLSQAREPVQVQVETLGSARERSVDDLAGRRGEEQTFDSEARHQQDLHHNDATRDQAAAGSRELLARRSRRAARNARLDVWS